jgi:hypothetical protein
MNFSAHFLNNDKQERKHVDGCDLLANDIKKKNLITYLP